MTQELRITVDANLYYKGGLVLSNETSIDLWKKKLRELIDSTSVAYHKFINVKVDIVPHDNDKDYTEEDAEKHLNGERGKKRKTYAEDFFEKFPNADKSGGCPGVCRDSVYGINEDCTGRTCSNCWKIAMPDESEDADA